MCAKLRPLGAALGAGLILALAACGSATTLNPTLETLTSPAVTLTAAREPTATPTLELTPAGPLQLVVWWPDTLAPASKAEAVALLQTQIAAFEAAQPDIEVELRLKKAAGIGGILEMLRAASAVAPGARPDLLLLQRADLLTAVQANLLEPLEGRVSSAILGDLYTAALELGQVGGQLHGLAYALEVQHVAYAPPPVEGNFASFETTLAAGRPLVFAAGQPAGVSEIFLLHYVSAGGSLADLNLGRVNVDALRAVFAFYAEAAERGVLPRSVANYTTISDYFQEFKTGASAAVITSTLYQQMVAEDQRWLFAPIPTASGQPATLLDGWMWATTAASGDRQAAATRFLNWMFEVERQAELTQAAGWLPSQRTARRMQSQPNTGYLNFANGLLLNASPALSESLSASTARVLENALLAVISGQRRADEAVQDVVNQLNGG